MPLDLPLPQQALRNFDKHIREPRILLLRRYNRRLPRLWSRETHYQFLADCCVSNRDFDVYVLAREIGDAKQSGIAGLGGGGESIGADLERRTFGNAVEGVQEGVGSVLPDLAATIGVTVVEDGVCAELAEEGRIAGGAGCDDVQAGAFCLW